MKQSSLKIDDSLIISRLSQKELISRKTAKVFDTPLFPLVTHIKLRPFFDNIPIGLGLNLETIGNKIINAQIERGFFYHDVENNITNLSLKKSLSAISRLNTNAPIFYQSALLAAWFDLANEPTPNLSKLPFAIAMEFSRIAHHLMVLKNIFYCLELFSLVQLINLCEQFLKDPIDYYKSIDLNDNVNHHINQKQINNILAEAASVVDEMAVAVNVEEKLAKSLSQKAIINLSIAGMMGLCGSYLRANRNSYDLRHSAKAQIFYETVPDISITEGGDAYARFSLRIFDILASIKWLRKTCSSSSVSNLVLPHEDQLLKNPKKSFAFGEIEGPEGDVKVGLFAKNQTNSIVCRIRTPAYFIAQAIPLILTNTQIGDLALLLFSLGISAQEVDK